MYVKSSQSSGVSSAIANIAMNAMSHECHVDRVAWIERSVDVEGAQPRMLD